MESATFSPTLKEVHTSCLRCVFSQSEHTALSEGARVVQTGCQLGYLEKYRARGEVLDAVDDGDNEFSVINGRLCRAFRTQAWLEAHQSDLLGQLKKELALRFSALVLLEEVSEEAIERTAKALAAQSRPPFEVYFINNQDSIKPGRLNALLWGTLGSQLTWRIESILPEEKGRPSRLKAIDMTVAKLKGSFYGVFQAGYEPPALFVESLERALNEGLEQFSLLRPLPCGNALVVQTAFHNHPLVEGNSIMWAGPEGEEVCLENIIAKAEFLSEHAEQPHMVKDVSEMLEVYL